MPPKKSRSRTSSTGSVKKKRAPSAYNLFMKKTMKALNAEDKKAGRKPDAGKNMKKMAVMWNAQKKK